jgi:hypothetical protein
MRVSVEAKAGELAESVGDAVVAVFAAAVADGATRDQVRERIAKAIGATKLSVNVRKKPVWRFLEDAQDEMHAIYTEVMAKAVDEIVILLGEAVEDVDVGHYREQLK